MKKSELKQIIKEEISKVLKEADYSQQVDQMEANAKLFIKNPALKQYTTSNDQYGFAIMEVPVAKLETATKMKIEDILAMDGGILSISLDQSNQTVDIILDRTDEF